LDSICQIKEVKKQINSLTDLEKEEIELMTNLVSEVIKRRMELNLTQRDLAKLTGVPQPQIARFETFGTVPRIDTILKIIKPLGLKLEIGNKITNSSKGKEHGKIHLCL
jgi:transcriptional regulator with XRE-family HTH domain